MGTTDVLDSVNGPTLREVRCWVGRRKIRRPQILNF